MFNKNALIVSCQADKNDPFNSPSGVARFAKAAEMGGAQGIRSEGIENTKEIISIVNIPVIGLVKSIFDDGSVKITGTLNDVKRLINIRCPIIAIDGTNRIREGVTGSEFISNIKRNFDCLIMADISTEEEGLTCQEAGADYISTTLNGYTPSTIKDNNDKPNFYLVEQLASQLKIPLFAEGRIATPNQAKEMIKKGAFGVVVGTIITRPKVITNRFVKILIP